MKTEVVRVNPTDPQPEAIARAADVLQRGGLVAFPTETVYGLGARAFEAAAVTKIFAAKGRPANNPLIVHFAQLPFMGREPPAFWPETASRLAARFWPGPLTLVLPKPDDLPDIVTARGPTWAIRVPDHRVTHALLLASGPLAAPSANVSTALSATTAEHVIRSLDGKVDLVLDGGVCPGGIESTVLDLTASPPRVLRPGPILPSEIREVIGEVTSADVRLSGDAALPSPGTSIRHYAPRATLECFADEKDAAHRIDELRAGGKHVEWLKHPATAATLSVSLGPLRTDEMPADAGDYAAVLYDKLHSADRRSADHIVVSLPPETEAWLAVRDRLRRAAQLWNA